MVGDEAEFVSAAGSAGERDLSARFAIGAGSMAWNRRTVPCNYSSFCFAVHIAMRLKAAPEISCDQTVLEPRARSPGGSASPGRLRRSRDDADGQLPESGFHNDLRSVGTSSVTNL